MDGWIQGSPLEAVESHCRGEKLERLVIQLLAGPGTRQKSGCSKWLPRETENLVSPEDPQADLSEQQWPPVGGDSLPAACGEMNPAAAKCMHAAGEQPGLCSPEKCAATKSCKLIHQDYWFKACLGYKVKFCFNETKRDKTPRPAHALLFQSPGCTEG